MSTAFAYSFRASLGIALATSFTQRLWSVFRKRPLKAVTIDMLFSALRNPFSIMSFGFLRHAHLEWFLALVFWSIPIASIFPPGAIRVGIKPNVIERAGFSVPTYDGRFMAPAGQAPAGQINRRENWDAVNSQAMFLMWVDGDYA